WARTARRADHSRGEIGQVEKRVRTTSTCSGHRLRLPERDPGAPQHGCAPRQVGGCAGQHQYAALAGAAGESGHSCRPGGDALARVVVDSAHQSSRGPLTSRDYGVFSPLNAAVSLDPIVDDEEVDLRAYLGVLSRRWKLIVTDVILGDATLADALRRYDGNVL